MVKIRVYELARDLNVTNKALLEKMRNMDIDVKSHMSSIDDEIVIMIKKNLLGSPKKEVDEKRIKPTIIRRRKKRVQQEPVQVETAIEPEEPPKKDAPPKDDASGGAVVQTILSKEKPQIDKPAKSKLKEPAVLK
jgi:translation initiation factor IF-2